MEIKSIVKNKEKTMHQSLSDLRPLSDTEKIAREKARIKANTKAKHDDSDILAQARALTTFHHVNCNVHHKGRKTAMARRQHAIGTAGSGEGHYAAERLQKVTRRDKTYMV